MLNKNDIYALLLCKRFVINPFTIVSVRNESRGPNVQASDLKKRIESLIEREYLRRDDNKATMYHYVA